MEDNISRKFAIAVVTILVIILVTNNFMDLSGEVTRSVAKSAVTRTCYDSDDKVYDNGGWNIYKGGYARDGRNYYPDKCWSDKTLLEAYCRGGIAFQEAASCTEKCIRTVDGYYACKQVVQTTWRRVTRR